MPEYNLKLLIDGKDLENVRAAQQRITLAKPVSSEGTPNVIWLSIDPFASVDVGWSEQYGIYASTTSVQDGAVISKLSESEFPAQSGGTYAFNSSALFNGPFMGNVPEGSYGVQDDMPYSSYPVLTFGLTQTALVDQKPFERKPISATPVLATQFATMTPFTSVYVWLQSQFESETIITKIVGRYAIAKFGGKVKELTLKYDPAAGLFVGVAEGKTVREHPNVEISLPLVA